MTRTGTISSCEHDVRDTGRKQVAVTQHTSGFTFCLLKVNTREISHTTVAFAIPHLHPDEVLHPERVADTALGEGVTAAVLRAIQLTR